MQVSGFRIYFLEPGYFFSKILSEFRKKIVALHGFSAGSTAGQQTQRQKEKQTALHEKGLLFNMRLGMPSIWEDEKEAEKVPGVL